jgi:DNA damage-binding protein 1
MKGAERSKLSVLLAHPDPEVLFFSFEELVTGQKKLVVNHTLPLRERGTRPAEFFNNLFVHPSGKLAVVHCFMGRIKVLQLKAGDYEKDFDVAYVHIALLTTLRLTLSIGYQNSTCSRCVSL